MGRLEFTATVYILIPEADKRSLDSFILVQKGQQERGQRQASMDKLVLSRTQRESQKWEGKASELADLVEGRDKILKSVAESKTSPQQIKEVFDKYEQSKQEQARKQEQ